MKEWGSELWDRLDLVVAYNKKETQDLEGIFGKYLKERGEIEKEYCKSLRKLVTNYLPKENKKEKEPIEDETSQSKYFRLMLEETRYQANQHELLSENLFKIFSSIQKKTKEFGDVTKKCIKEAKKLAEEKDKSDKCLEKAKMKYQRSFFDYEQSERDYTKADNSNDVSRNQIEKLKKTTNTRNQICEQYRGEYAKELLRANEEQHTYYFNKLPTVLNNLQNLDVSRSNFVKEILTEGVRAEQKIVPIVVKCLEEVEKCIDQIDPHADTELVIYRYKTGNVPPADNSFEEMKLGDHNLEKTKTLQKRSKATPPSEHLFPKKRELEKKIEAMELEIAKGQKEIHALRLMYETYSQNPKYGDKKNFQGELEAATFKVQNLESQLHTLKTELSQINTRLDHLRNRTPVDTPSSGRRSPSHSDKGSMGYGTISNSSNSSEQDTDSLGEKPRVPEVGSSWDHVTSGWAEDDFNEEFEDLPPPPSNLGLARALYDFIGEEESNISMRAGEEFHLLEPDSGGWSKVQRMNMSEEGFVPTAFLEWIS